MKASSIRDKTKWYSEYSQEVCVSVGVEEMYTFEFLQTTFFCSFSFTDT